MPESTQQRLSRLEQQRAGTYDDSIAFSQRDARKLRGISRRAERNLTREAAYAELIGLIRYADILGTPDLSGFLDEDQVNALIAAAVRAHLDEAEVNRLIAAALESYLTGEQTNDLIRTRILEAFPIPAFRENRFEMYREQEFQQQIPLTTDARLFYAWELESGTLPPGVQFVEGIILGTPEESIVTPFVVGTSFVLGVLVINAAGEQNNDGLFTLQVYHGKPEPSDFLVSGDPSSGYAGDTQSNAIRVPRRTTITTDQATGDLRGVRPFTLAQNSGPSWVDIVNENIVANAPDGTTGDAFAQFTVVNPQGLLRLWFNFVN